MNLGMVMVTRDRGRLLEQTIRSLYRATLNFDLVLVDDCSTDRDPIQALQREFGFQVLWNDEPTPLGESKNRGIRALPHHQMLYLTDNDVFFRPFWLESLRRAWLQRPEDIRLLGGGCHEWLGTNRVAYRPNIAYHYKDAISGWSWLFERRTWEEYGPLDGSALGSGQSEDWAFCQRIKQAGYEVASIQPEVVVHCGRTNTEGRPAIGSETIRDQPGIVIE